MLTLRRKEGEWITITHAASGDVVRIRVRGVGDAIGKSGVNLTFDDDVRNFEISRPERKGEERTVTA